MKFTPGALAGRMSGGIHSEVFSRNRYGAYVRARTIPVNPNTSYQQEIRALLAKHSAAFQGLTGIQRAAWNTYAQNNPIRDRLGESQVLTGHVAFVGINSRLEQASETTLTVPPVEVGPDSLETLSIAIDIGPGATTLNFTPDPIGADNRMFVRAAVVNSVGINYVKNLMKLCEISAKNHPSGTDPTTLLQTRFGTLSAGQKVVIECSIFDTTTGLLSLPLQAETVVVDTT